ncbi:LTA synthase family protein, partial [bacterium]|nr:LTA synthase family protein [bacterium]
MLVGLALSLLIERLLRPGVQALRQRHPAALVLHGGLWLLVFAMELAVFRRPWFAAVMGLTLLAVLVLVNNAKYQALREPFIFQDFEYFVDT